MAAREAMFVNEVELEPHPDPVRQAPLPAADCDRSEKKVALAP